MLPECVEMPPERGRATRVMPRHTPMPYRVCVNSTSGGERSLATPAYQGRLALVPLPLGAAVNKIKGATLTPPSA